MWWIEGGEGGRMGRGRWQAGVHGGRDGLPAGINIGFLNLLTSGRGVATIPGVPPSGRLPTHTERIFPS